MPRWLLRLALHVHLAHVDHTLQPKHRGHRGRGDAMLARAGFGNHAAFAHAARQEHLAETVVDLVRARVAQFLALKVDLGGAQLARHPLGQVEGRGPPHVLSECMRKLLAECGVAARPRVLTREVQQGRHEGLGDVHAAVRPVMAVVVGLCHRLRHCCV